MFQRSERRCAPTQARNRRSRRSFCASHDPDPIAGAACHRCHGALAACALFIFARCDSDRDIGLLVVAALAIGFSIFPHPDAPGGEPLDPIRFFAGFANEALIAICALVMASQGLVATGALAPLGHVGFEVAGSLRRSAAWARRDPLALGAPAP